MPRKRETEYEILRSWGTRTVWESNSRQDIWSTENKGLPNGEHGDMGPGQRALQAMLGKTVNDFEQAEH